MRRTAALLLSALCLLFCACENDVYEIDLSRALMENGEYAYPGLEWGLSPADAEALLGFAIVEQTPAALTTPSPGAKASPPVVRILKPEDDEVRIKLNGNYGTVRFQFMDDRLISVTAVFKDGQTGLERNNLDKLLEKTNAQLREQFGEPASENLDQPAGESSKLTSYYRWEGTEDNDPRTRNSLLSLGYVKDADGKIISVSVMVVKANAAVQGS